MSDATSDGAEYYADCGYCGRPEGFAVVLDDEKNLQRLECMTCGSTDVILGRQL